ncbi:hypothetical protein SAMN04487905_12124 [Actinopolyspora xinjiangensis]|uniref:Uncharacterized protein n=1 Tax=Actinopolyspora xinjiangensis TaxID=405564 RepID=A0A1H0X1B3_9ACTN|nr:hypothetical protein [Actinopolyspora xinjiangensis]SDP96702.1 hypothetical protein SAMN04487905_12124 [Actinopolyspora xinjiangensis]
MDRDITLLELDHDEIAVQRTSTDTWDIYVQPGHYWDTKPTGFLDELHRNGEVAVLHRDTGSEWNHD